VGGNLCTGAALLDRNLSGIDIIIKPNEGQKATLEGLKKVATETPKICQTFVLVTVL
jgi:hypothetical protein